MKELKNLKIEKIWYWWVGIAKTDDGKKILIKWWALPGSIIDCNITRKKSDYLEWHITKIHEYDKAYTDGEIFCPHFFSNLQNNLEVKKSFSPLWEKSPSLSLGQTQESGEILKQKIWCGWCKRQLISYPRQLELKQQIIEDCFRKIENKPTILPIVPSPQDRGYRNKIEFSFGVYISQQDGVNSRRNLWFHKQWEFSKIIDIDSCWLISHKANKVFEYIKNLCFNSGLATFDQKFHRWFFRHLVMREWTNTNQLLINLAIAPAVNNDIENLEKRRSLKEKFKTDKIIQENITTFVITYNSWLADIVRWPDIQVENLFGDWYIFDKLIFDLSPFVKRDVQRTEGFIESTFRISPFSFFQTNTHWAERLFQTWADAISSIKWKILDLYCGAGSIGISFLNMWIWDSVLWIDIVEDAIKDANHNAKINWIENSCKFIASPSEKILNNHPEIQKELKDIWLVIVDPPREWLHKNVVERIDTLRQTNKFELLYISCNPTTMARDIELFIEKWFKLKSLKPVDMFPQTHHIETVWVLI